MLSIYFTLFFFIVLLRLDLFLNAQLIYQGSLTGRAESGRKYPYGSCTSDQYMCTNQRCIHRSRYCDGRNDCYDNSDETHCNKIFYTSCPTRYAFIQCGEKCIPKIWECDGISDCFDGFDEDKLVCLLVTEGEEAMQKATRWLKEQSRDNSVLGKWGIDVPRVAVALYFADKTFFASNDAIAEQITYEQSLLLLKNIIRELTNEETVSINKLALYLDALLVSCVNPRNFYGLDIVTRLREEVDQLPDSVNPVSLIALCNAGDKMTEQDVAKLVYVFNTPLRAVWTDMQALALMALSCIATKEAVPNFSHSNLTSFASELKRKQEVDGSFQSFHATALVVQALLAFELDESVGWDLSEALNYLIMGQSSDGSFGNLLNTYYVLPVLKLQSLADIKTEHCKVYSEEEKFRIAEHLEKSGNNLVQVKYAVAFGDVPRVKYAVDLRIDNKSSVFDLMKIASDLDPKYSFKYVTQDSKPHIYEVNGIQDDPENGTFWFLCIVNKTANVAKPTMSSPADVIVKDNGEYAMWYRTTHGLPEMLKSIS